MRPVAALLALSAIQISSGQQPSENLFLTVRPDIAIVVKAHPTGANVVEITMLNPKYPPELLVQRIEQVATNLGTRANGATAAVYPLGNDPNMKFVKGSFGINGLMDTHSGIVRIQPLLRAFVGDPEPLTLKGFSLVFEGIRANERTVQTFSNRTVRAQARILKSPIEGIEYRIALSARKPQEVEFPEQVPEPKRNPSPSLTDEPVPIIAWIGLACLATGAGALVYLALLRTGKSALARPKK